ncbi:Ribosomal protein lysine methyltransferase [Sporothrix epigloea]|uniref:Ribosomal protein lysine methyltransferase n=1 Tax=Sporothrix epigloea TaxID=1892477 RepID=A0ABP0DQA6_9PEZI
MPVSPLGRLLARFGPEVDDIDEETFLLFAHKRPDAQNLGFLDAHAAVLELSVAGVDLTIHQSPTVLNSNRSGGTTGAVLWKITPAIAEWLARSDNVFFADGDGPSVLGPDSAVIELGCGIAGVIGLALAGKHVKTASPRPAAAPSIRKKTKGKWTKSSPTSATAPTAMFTNTVARYVLTDQPYVAKFLQRNLQENGVATADRVCFCPLDWELDAIRPGDRWLGGQASFAAVLACDCIYNEALVMPLVQTCVNVCRLRETESEKAKGPTLCIVAQQLRDADVLSAWLTVFSASFCVWRVPEALLTPPLRPEAGFVVHVGILKEAVI